MPDKGKVRFPTRRAKATDDAQYLMGPLAWLGWLSPILIGADVGTTVMTCITGIRLPRIRHELPHIVQSPE